MLIEHFVLKNETGLHARPASRLVKTASTFTSSIMIVNEGKQHNAKSIINLLSLGLKKGAKIEIAIDGEDEIGAMDAIKDLLNNNFED